MEVELATLEEIGPVETGRVNTDRSFEIKGLSNEPYRVRLEGLAEGGYLKSVRLASRDLPDHLTVDIGSLVKVGDSIHVRDVSLGDKVQILDDPDEMIVNATYAKVEVEAPVAAAEGVVPAEGEGAEPELSVERGKKEEEAAEAEEKEKKK